MVVRRRADPFARRRHSAGGSDHRDAAAADLGAVVVAAVGVEGLGGKKKHAGCQ